MVEAKKTDMFHVLLHCTGPLDINPYPANVENMVSS